MSRINIEITAHKNTKLLLMYSPESGNLILDFSQGPLKICIRVGQGWKIDCNCEDSGFVEFVKDHDGTSSDMDFFNIL